MNNQNTLRPDLSSLETKAKFFAQYWGQNIYREHDRPKVNDYVDTLEEINEQSYLQLTPLSDITDEDAIECYKIHFKGHLKKDIRPDASRIEFAKRHIISPIEVCIPAVVDYLRSRGYALPFMGYSVDELIESGYLVLRKGGDHE